METTQQKYWPSAKVPEGAVYVGSVASLESEDHFDLYAMPDGSGAVFDGSETHYIIRDNIPYSLEANLSLVRMLRAHLAKPPQPPATPAMTREQMRQAVAQAIANLEYSGGEFPSSWDKSRVAGIYAQADAALDVLHPELKPEPVKVEQTDGEKLVDHWIKENLNVKTMAGDVDARDAQHKRELDDLRYRCAEAGRVASYIDNTHSGRAFEVKTAVLSVPLMPKPEGR